MDRSKLLPALLGHDWLDLTWVLLVRVVAGHTSSSGAGLGVPYSRLGWSMLRSHARVLQVLARQGRGAVGTRITT